ncbi:putative E3 ubiquitin-protein ligase RNF185 [Hypsibius exemplaris]|uniref:RING-type E3 ubiquitin transferase n=1 Tax=Hypsibius exemplaris TaxID=2072580 RepID=A0A1W0WQP3_HYPEX|nr:putative E3 ubiquitin-protein ligase RNF185 [Hypsibius exemplaris]
MVLESVNLPSTSKDNSSTDPDRKKTDPPASGSDQPDKGDVENVFECNICLGSPNDPVISLCGHLFCWPCLHEWLEMKPVGTQTCPVCKAAIDREKVIPLFGRNSKGEDPRNKAVPPRPHAHRTEHTGPGPYHNPLFEGANFLPFGTLGGPGGGFHMTIGIGASPFHALGAMLGFTNFAGQVPPGLPSQIFLGIAMMMIFWLIFF